LLVSCSSGYPQLEQPDPWGQGGAAGEGNGGEGGGSAGKGGSGNSGNSGAGGMSYGGSGGSAAAAGTGGGEQDAASDGPLPDVVFGYDAPVNDTSLNADTACAASAYEATLVPLDMYVMIDRSGSMVEPGYSWTATGPGQISITGGDCNYVAGQNPLNSKWCYAVHALVGYFKSPTAAGNRVALQFYPTTGYNCTSPLNNSLSTPAVAFQTIPGGNTALINALNQADPLGANTPTKAALHGLAGFTSTHETSGRTMIGILVTDGVPNACAPDDATSVGAVAAAHLAATGIKTYVIGMDGAAFSTLETIATHGGAPAHAQYCAPGINPCHFYNVGKGDGQVFVEVLKKIQQTAIGCTYKMPEADGGLVDPKKISVEYLPGGGGVQKLKQVASHQACADDAFYYDTNSPPNIVLCPQTCTEVQADPQAKVQILLACQGN
jgi:hypothetical protein